MNQINPLGPIKAGGIVEKGLGIKRKTEGPSFKETFSNFLSDVNQMQQKADQSIQKMISGEITDVHQVMSSVEEAGVAFNMMMEIRNKVMDAYQEIMRIRL